MRMSPKDVPPIVHQGICYQAPPWYQAEVLRADELSRHQQMLQVLQQVSADQALALHDDPAGCSQILLEHNFTSAEVEQMQLYLQSEQVIRQVLARSLQELISQSLSLGQMPDPRKMISPEWLLAALEQEGTLSSEQRQQAVSRWQASQTALKRGLEFAHSQQTGWLLATAASTGEVLWSLRVYANQEDEEVLITSLQMQGEHLLVLDEKRRQYLIDLNSRQVIQSS